MEHNCKQEGKFASMEADIRYLKQADIKSDERQTRIEEKLDKILWFILGQSVTLVVTVVGGLALYAMVGK